MAEDSAVKIMETLGLNYDPAIQATLKFEKKVVDLQTQLLALKATAGQTAQEISNSFSAELNKLKTSGLGIKAKDVAQSKVILDQYGETLVQLGKKSKETAREQSKLNKELQNLFHLRKTQQIDAQTFVERASPYRVETEKWQSLQKQEQVSLVRELTKAEEEHRKVLENKLKTEKAISAAQAETVQEVKRSTLASMDATAASIQQKTTAKNLSDQYSIQASLIRNQLSALQQKLSTEGRLSAEEVKQTYELKEQLSILKSQQAAEIATNAAQAETVQEVKRSTLASMDALAVSIQQKASAKNLSEQYSVQTNLIRSQLSLLQQKLAAEGKLSAEEVKQTYELKEQLSILKSQQAAEIASITKKSPNLLGNEFSRRSSWFLTGTAFYGGINAAKEAVQTISEVEMGVTEIARVMEDSTFVFKDYRDELLQLGVDYGQTFENVQDIALRWAQAGYNVKDSLDNTRTSLLALNTAELDASNATESLVGIMSQWNLTSQELPLVLDKINKTADDFTVTSQDLVDGLLRSSGAAKIMGLSIDQTISLLTVMREASGRTGREVGNALNSILSYIQRPIAIEVLEDNGIKVFADAAKTQFRNVMDIFQDIAAKWPELSASVQDGFVKAADDAGLYSEELAEAIGVQQEWNDLQQRDIAQAAAGVYRRNYFIGMIERLAGAQNVLNNMMDAAGYSMRENERTMDTVEKKYNSLKTAAQQLAVAIGDAGLLDILKGLTDSAVEAIQWFDGLDQEWKTLIITATELLAIVGSLKAAMSLFTTKNLLLGAESVLSMLPGWGKLIALILSAAGAVSLYSHNSKAAADEELITSSKRLASQLQEKERVSELVGKYEELKTKVKLTDAEHENLKSIVSELAKIYPNLTASINDTTGALDHQINAIKRLNETQKQALLQQTKINIAQTQVELSKYADESKNIAELVTASIDYANYMDSFQNWAQNYMKVFGRNPSKDDLPASLATMQSQFGSPKDFYSKYKTLLDDIMTEGYFERDTRAALDRIIEQYSKKANEITQKTLDLEANKKLLDDILNGKFDVSDTTKSVLPPQTTSRVGSGTGGGKSTSTSIFDRTIDRYILYESVLSDVNNAIALNNTLQQQYEGTEKISLIEKENALLRQQQEALHAINNERRKESEELKKYLSSQGVSFDDKGNPVNYQKVLSSMSAYINKLGETTDAEKAAKNAAIDKYSKIEEAIERYMQLIYTDIPQASNEWRKLEGTIKDNEKAINELRFTEAEKLIEHLTAMGEYSTQQQIEAYKKLYAFVGDSTEKQWYLDEKIFNLKKKLTEEQEKITSDAYTKAENSIQHWAKVGVYSIEQQIEKYRELYSLKKLTTEEQWKLDERIFDLYKSSLNEQQDIIKKSYDERIRLIDKELEKEKEKQQEIIRGIEEKEKALNRSESERDYEKKIEDLNKELAYWQVRTSEEARKKVAEIREQIAEEEHAREVELKRQEYEDDKKAAQDAITVAENKAKEEKELWEATYKEMESLFESHNLNIIAMAATASKEAYQQWVENYLIPMQEALAQGDLSAFQSRVSGAVNSISTLSNTRLHDWGMTEEDYQTFIANGNAWKTASEEERARLNAQNNALRVKYGRDPALGEYPEFHKGAETLSYGIAMFKPGELVFPPHLSADLKTIIKYAEAGAFKQSGSTIQTTDNSRKVQFTGPLLNVENMHLEDQADERSLAVELQKVVTRIL